LARAVEGEPIAANSTRLANVSMISRLSRLSIGMFRAICEMTCRAWCASADASSDW
jgi:hypothetical protein